MLLLCSCAFLLHRATSKHQCCNKFYVPLLQSPKTESGEIPSYFDGKLQLLEGSTPLKHVGNLAVSITKTEKVLCRDSFHFFLVPRNLRVKFAKYSSHIRNHEVALKIVMIKRQKSSKSYLNCKVLTNLIFFLIH
ncbi:hypothetical protein Patl1_20441 [Pistacia atlantica]|uniref:Uncharacterized protein n=1 Tax=Pistacia atlantica TaxID=434234 RepID=A0ACC1BIP1_9ROSI|nr:hypothetical protein Patl1_20441 [Pistacia atlantica]